MARPVSTTAPGSKDNMPEISVAQLRSGAREILQDSLKKALQTQLAPEGLARLTAEDAPGPLGEPRALGRRLDSHACATAAGTLEDAIHARAATAGRAFRATYIQLLGEVKKILVRQVGPFPDDVAGVMLLDGRRAASEVLEESLAEEQPTPQETIRRLFVRTLMRASPCYARDRDRALETARAIEASCFSATIRISKESEEPPQRQWDSLPFVDIYSTRCGVIATLLDPSSAPCAAYGATLIEGLRSGAVRPEELGSKTEKDLCPQATAAERAEIAQRTNQRLVMKESNLFRCPHCGARRCTYREVQQRSLDEAPDYKCLCLSCHHRFTGRN